MLLDLDTLTRYQPFAGVKAYGLPRLVGLMGRSRRHIAGAGSAKFDALTSSASELTSHFKFPFRQACISKEVDEVLVGGMTSCAMIMVQPGIPSIWFLLRNVG